MTIINLSVTPATKVDELAAKAVLQGVLIECDGEDTGTAPEHMYDCMTTSRSDKSKTYLEIVYSKDGVWYGICRPYVWEDAPCKANELGGILCSHLALAVSKLKEQGKEIELLEKEVVK